jgi:DNA polymerase-3 subunit alpha
VQVRVSSKSQKKFAILMIGNGMESFELPIWPELYEEKAQLLGENRMLVAVLQVDKRDGTTRLSCKWLDDLTHVSEQMMEECDQAFDKAKFQVEKFAAIKNKKIDSSNRDGAAPKAPLKATPKTAPLPPPERKAASIKIDLEKVRLSHIMQIKELFSEFRGPLAVTVEFASSDATVGALKINSTWGITATPQLKEKLHAIPSIALVNF